VTDGVAGFITQYEHWHTLDRPFGEHRTYCRRGGEPSIRAPAKNLIPVTHNLASHATPTNQPTKQPNNQPASQQTNKQTNQPTNRMHPELH